MSSFSILSGSKVIDITSYLLFLVMSINFDPRNIEKLLLLDMPAKYFSIIRNYMLSVSSQRKYNFYHQNRLLDAFRMNSRNITCRNPSMVIPMLANQDLTPMLETSTQGFDCFIKVSLQ